MVTQQDKDMITRASLITATIILTIGLFSYSGVIPSNTVTAQKATHPIKKKGLLDTLRTNVVPTNLLVQHIERRGVDFQMNSADEAELRAAGARPEIIEAVRANYRPMTTAATSSSTNSSRPNTPTNSSSAKVPSGPPLSENEVLTLLQSGVSSSRVEAIVEVRGVNFTINPALSREIKAAGGTNSLIGSISANLKEEQSSGNSDYSPFGSVDTSVVSSKAPDYDELTDQATSAFKASDADTAIRLLQQAISMDSSQPTAYGLLGVAYLYGKQDAASAQRAMNSAVERNGAAVFYVYHDHDGFFQTFCEGSLFVTRANVTFRANDGVHTFEAVDTNIKEAKLNGFVGSQYGAFHLKVDQGGSKKNYNFAPLTKSKDESNMIVNLISNYK
jgi:hypothetical protein